MSHIPDPRKDLTTKAVLQMLRITEFNHTMTSVNTESCTSVWTGSEKISPVRKYVLTFRNAPISWIFPIVSARLKKIAKCSYQLYANYTLCPQKIVFYT